MTLLHFTWFYIIPIALLHCTLLHIIIPWLYVTLLESRFLYHCCTSLYFTLHNSTIPLLLSTLLYISLPWLYFTLLDSTLLNHGSTSLYFTLLYSPWLYFTLLYSTLHYHGSTSLYLTVHYSTMALLHLTWVYILLPLLYFTLLAPT